MTTRRGIPISVGVSCCIPPRPINGMLCVECGCTDYQPCVTNKGPCSWVQPALFSACADPYPNLSAAGFEY